MLPESGCACWLRRGMVKSPDRKGDDHGTAAARDVGPGRPRRAGTPLPDHPRRHHPHPLPDDPAARRGPPGRRDRATDPLQPRHGAPRAQALPGQRSRCRAAPAPSGSAAPLPARLGAGAGPGRRLRPTQCGGGQCAVDLSAAGRLPGRGHRVSGGDRVGADRAAPGRVCVQAAPLGAGPQGPRPAGMGKQRLRVEALLAAAASPLPPPAHTLIPDATLADDLFPTDLPRLLGLLARADLYLHDEVEVALHPTLTRVWSRAGRSGQRLVQAPGKNDKQYGFGLVDWRDGWLDFELADGRRAVPFCEQLRRVVARSQARGKIAMVILDNLGIHTPRGRGCCGSCWPSWASSWCWSTPPPTTPTPTASSGCGAACAAPSPTPTSAEHWQSWWPTPTGGPTRSLRRRCCRRSAARSHPTSSRFSARNSTMRHELPGSI